MKEATGEVSMTVVTLVAIAVIGAILALFWKPIANKISGLWNESENKTRPADMSGINAFGIEGDDEE